ncbi:hypothetical protein CDAR_562531 [Caerostris darwini]|uniref:Uncharacterized protein n=1 Tax=Caerostris darwini TaxID=1538125 RepID=A0AAV4X7L1_9ARAC|nr:hypothetical protein CDAR_562531 [Caerostris darwini]
MSRNDARRKLEIWKTLKPLEGFSRISSFSQIAEISRHGAKEAEGFSLSRMATRHVNGTKSCANSHQENGREKRTGCAHFLISRQKERRTTQHSAVATGAACKIHFISPNVKIISSVNYCSGWFRKGGIGREESVQLYTETSKMIGFQAG